jgi:hypothetical protein
MSEMLVRAYPTTIDIIAINSWYASIWRDHQTEGDLADFVYSSQKDQKDPQVETAAFLSFESR